MRSFLKTGGNKVQKKIKKEGGKWARLSHTDLDDSTSDFQYDAKEESETYAEYSGAVSSMMSEISDSFTDDFSDDEFDKSFNSDRQAAAAPIWNQMVGAIIVSETEGKDLAWDMLLSDFLSSGLYISRILLSEFYTPTNMKTVPSVTQRGVFSYSIHQGLLYRLPVDSKSILPAGKHISHNVRTCARMLSEANSLSEHSRVRFPFVVSLDFIGLRIEISSLPPFSILMTLFTDVRVPPDVKSDVEGLLLKMKVMPLYCASLSSVAESSEEEAICKSRGSISMDDTDGVPDSYSDFDCDLTDGKDKIEFESARLPTPPSSSAHRSPPSYKDRYRLPGKVGLVLGMDQRYHLNTFEHVYPAIDARQLKCACVYRPEFFDALPDAFIANVKAEGKSVTQALQDRLMNHCLPSFSMWLLDHVHVQGAELIAGLHQHGLNIRMLGRLKDHLHTMSMVKDEEKRKSIHHLSSVVLTEMVVRALKSFIRTRMRTCVKRLKPFLLTALCERIAEVLRVTFGGNGASLKHWNKSIFQKFESMFGTVEGIHNGKELRDSVDLYAVLTRVLYLLGLTLPISTLNQFEANGTPIQIGFGSLSATTARIRYPNLEGGVSTKWIKWGY